MKISCLPVSLFEDICSGKMDIPGWAREAKKIGFDGIDISIMFLKNKTPTYLDGLKRELSEIGMPIVMMTTYPDFTNPDPVQRKRELHYLKSDIALASQLGIPYLRILAGQAHDGITREACIDLADLYFHEVDGCGREFNVNLVFENHGKPGAWDRVDFTYDPENFLAICERIRDTHIRINFDTGNVTAHGENVMDVIPQVIDRLETVHVTDMRVRGEFSPTTIGTGETPLAEFFQYIKQSGFDGWLCIEEASQRGLEGIREARRYVEETWEKS